MGFFDTLKQNVQGHFDKRKEQREFEERLHREAELERKRIFEEEFKKNAFEVAQVRAKRDAANKSGLQKLRATNRARRLQENSVEPGSFFEKLREHTQKNLAKREENLKRTAEMRETARKIREERILKRQTERQQRMASRKPFGYIQ